MSARLLQACALLVLARQRGNMCDFWRAVNLLCAALEAELPAARINQLAMALSATHRHEEE